MNSRTTESIVENFMSICLLHIGFSILSDVWKNDMFEVVFIPVISAAAIAREYRYAFIVRWSKVTDCWLLLF